VRFIGTALDADNGNDSAALTMSIALVSHTAQRAESRLTILLGTV